ncbi:membrane protein [Secundilactobacillus silagincola]|uniref:Membrane protein n=1 Tax=Secundilactobacillus silagincola TaxID=1714681 RepID=A0A1Z5J3I1_9LACO|nr:membrane protein [Secundilactobacillus silagincola]
MVTLLIVLIIVTLLNLVAIAPLVKGQTNQRLVWIPLLALLIAISLLIILPITIWPAHLISNAISMGFVTWYTVATLYLWLTNWYKRQSHQSTKPDYLVVLGAKVTSSGPSKTLTRRLQTAIAIYTDQSVPPKLVLTGGQGSDEPQSEAAAMAGYLVRQQIQPHQLLLEQAATSTATNIKFSKQVIENDWQASRKPTILIVTSDYHLVRSKLLALQQHLPVSLAGSWTTTEALIPAMLREIAALLLQLKWPLVIFWIELTFLAQSISH